MTSGGLEGKVAVVTGASQGIGAAIAKRLAVEGANVVIDYIGDSQRAEKVVEEIASQGGLAVSVSADVAVGSEVRRLFAETIAVFGSVDILVNNAGIYEFQPLGAITEAHLQRQFKVNVFGLLLCCQQALDHFGPEGGCILNISSVASLSPPPTGSVYSATKAAVDAITKSLSKELGPKKIRVNSINAGIIDTEGLRETGTIQSHLFQRVIAQIPLGRVGRPEEIASAALFLVSDEAKWITGATLLVSGGLG